MRGARRLAVGWALMASVFGGLGAAATGGYQSVRAAMPTITGGGAFTLAITLEWFPCPSVCSSSSMTGTFAGELLGLDVSGNAYSVVFPDPTTVPLAPGPNVASTAITNSDTCLPQAQTSPAIATTSGTATIAFVINGGLLTRGSVISHGAKLTGSITWSRDLAAGTIGITGPTVNDSAGATVATGLLGAGAASFSVPTSAVFASCASQIANVTASLDGATVDFA